VYFNGAKSDKSNSLTSAILFSGILLRRRCMSSRLFIYYLYLATCTTPFPYRTTFVSFNSNITGVTGGAGTGGPSGAPEFIPVFYWDRVVQFLIFYSVFCRALFIFLFFFSWPLYCLSFFSWPLYCLSFFSWPLYCLSYDLRILIILLISSNIWRKEWIRVNDWI
jgi:hypothetical protein